MAPTTRSPDDPTTLRAGAARVEITPPAGGPMAGYFHERRSTGVLDPLYARALVLDDGTWRIGIVAVDAIALPAAVTAEARRLCPGLTALLVAATHTHTGPSTGPIFGVSVDESFLRGLPEQIAVALEEAVGRLEPVRATPTRAEAPRLVFNRRFRMRDGSVRMNPGIGSPEIVEPVGPTDPELLAVSFERADGAVVSSLSNFALHLDTVGGTQYSPDYPGAYLNLLGPEQTGLFLLGCCGDVNHIDVHGSQQQTGPDQSLAIGEALAEALHEARPRREEITATPLLTASEHIRWPRRKTHTWERAPLEAVVAGADPGRLAPLEEDIPDGLRAAYARERLALMSWPPAMEVEVQCLRIGEVALVTSPGEMFCAFGLAAKSLATRSTSSPAPDARASTHRPRAILPVTLANGYCGYVPTRAAFGEGGYETWLARSSFLAPECGDLWLAAVERLLAVTYTPVGSG